MKKALLKTTVCALVLGMACAASAATKNAQSYGESPSYDNFGVGYMVMNLDESDIDFDGFTLGFEKTLNKSWYAGVSYSDVSNKDSLGVGVSDIDAKSYLLGLGYIVPMSKTTSMDIFVGFAKSKVEFAGQSMSENGYQVGVNLRQRVGDLEWSLSPAYSDFSDGEDSSSFQVSLAAQYYLAPSVSLGAGFAVGEDANSVMVGVRYHF